MLGYLLLIMIGAKVAPFPAELPSESSFKLSLTCLAVVSPTENVISSCHLTFKFPVGLIALMTARTHRGLVNIIPKTLRLYIKVEHIINYDIRFYYKNACKIDKELLIQIKIVAFS